MAEEQPIQGNEDHTHCGCKKDDPSCYCDENGKKKFRKIPKNG